MLHVGDPAALTVIIPTRDRWPILARTLEALDAQTVTGFDVLVVVDGADQSVPDLGAARVLVKEHGGPGAARNYAVARTDRPLVLFLGDDMIPEPDLVERHLNRHRAEPERHVGVLGAARWHPDVASDPLHQWLDWSAMQFDYATIRDGNAGWQRFYSCNVSLKRDFFLAAGGFDEDFVYQYEDLDAGYRLGQHGLVLHYDERAVTWHLHRYDLDGLRRRFAGTARGERMMAAKHDWFEPWYRARVVSACAQRPVVLPWQRVAPLLPAGGLRGRVERRATRRYLQRLGPAFLEAWDAAGGPSG